MKTKNIIIFATILFTPNFLFAQSAADTIPSVISLKQSVVLAIKNQPSLKQAAIDEQINERNINISLSGWLPQVNSTGQYQHYFKGGPVAAATGVNAGGGSYDQYSALGLQASQVIYNNDVLQAARAANYSRTYYKQNTASNRINVVADVSKAFFDVLLSQKQLTIINQNITRLQRSLKDAHSRYQAGVVDKIDYKQATIALNNEVASRKQVFEAVNAKLAYLKQIMGVNTNKDVTLTYDSTRYEQEAQIDTNQLLNFNNRVEYQLLQTQKSLQNINVNYYKNGYLPSLSAVGSYNFIFLSDRFADLYSRSFQNAYVGLSLAFPIFQGGKRIQNLNKARLQVQRTDLDIVNLQNALNTEYVQALAGYKSSYAGWQALKENVILARDVYSVVSLQYREGVKTYLDVIVAQSDLRTAELNYYNALFQLLSNKIDLQRALGALAVE